MSRVLMIGAGGVGAVVARKCAQVPEIFSKVCIASRTVSKCRQIRDSIKPSRRMDFAIAQIDADKPKEVAALIRRFRPDLVVNVALPYQDLSIMDACLETGVNYLDTANYEPPDEAKFCYKWQWAYKKRFRDAGLMALLGCGFDPGVTNIFCAYAQKHHFDTIDSIDIVDCNGGDHGHPFATNFNPEINIREITQRGKYWEKGKWKSIDPMSIHKSFKFPGVGTREMYLLYHEELESLIRNIKGLKRIRFWMTFGEEYLTHLRVLQNVGMTRIDEVEHEGQKIVPIKLLKTLLPDPSSLAKNYKGKTSIGCVVQGKKDRKLRKYYIYNICDHAECYKEVKSQAVSYTTGVPAMIGAMMMLTGKWKGEGVFNVEEFDPDPFMEKLSEHGLPWEQKFLRKSPSI